MKFLRKIIYAKTPAGESLIGKLFELAGLMAFTYLLLLCITEGK